jgi:hypothetical protein
VAGLLACSLLKYLPITNIARQWFEESAEVKMKKSSFSFTLKAYSYGDSAGITPDFPFNPAVAGTKYTANVTGRRIKQNLIRLKFCTVG